MTPRRLIRFEGLAFLGLAVFLYARLGESWLLFALLILAPDVTIPLYLVNRRFGAAAYNLVHTYVGPIGLAAISVTGDKRVVVAIALIWLTHIGMDRFLGFGLKYPSDFKETHIQRL